MAHAGESDMKSISVAGTQVSYSRTGQGPGLLLLHGSGGDGQSTFGHLVDQFSDRYTVLVPDYAGCGASTVPEGRLTRDLLEAQVAAVLLDAGVGSVAVVGYSMGSQVAGALAAQHPRLVHALVLVGGRARNDDVRHRMVFEVALRLQECDPRLADRFMLSHGMSPAFFRSLETEKLNQLLQRPLPRHAKQRMDFSLNESIADKLSCIVCPTLVVGMTRDTLVPAYHAKELHTMIYGSEYAELDCGHAVFREATNQIASLIRQFLATTAALSA